LFLKSKGWRKITIISLKDYLPNDDIILNIVKYGIDYLNTNHSWIIFDIDNQLVKCSQFEEEYNYGKLYNTRNLNINIKEVI